MPPNLINSSAVSSANYYLGKNQKNLQESIKRLASGKKISGPGDDPGNLAVSMKLNAQLSRMSGLKNSVQNGISFLEVQDGALQNAGNILNRMSEIYSLTKGDALRGSDDIELYNSEFYDLQSQLYDISQLEFNSVSLFALYTNEGVTSDNAYGETWFNIEGWIEAKGFSFPPRPEVFDNTFSVKISPENDLQISIHKSPFLSALSIKWEEKLDSLGNGIGEYSLAPVQYGLTWGLGEPASFFDASGLGLGRSLARNSNFLSLERLQEWEENLNIPVNDWFSISSDNISILRAQNGATQSRLNFNTDHISSYETGLRSAIGRIEDVDIAEESANLAKHSILTKASAAMVAQASQSTQSIMRTLLGN